jgi:hypothetical protein
MDDITTNAPALKPRSHWRRFGLRTLLVVVLLFQVPLIWFCYARARVQREKAALQALGVGPREQVFRAVFDPITNRGGPPETRFAERLEKYGAFEYWYPVTWLLIGPHPLDVEQAKHLRNLPFVEVIAVDTPVIEYGATLPPKGLSRLKRLSVSYCTPPPGFIASAKHCRSLRTLKVEDCLLSPTHLQEIGELEQLRGLSFSGTTICEADWDFLSRLNELEFLSIDAAHLGEPFPLHKLPPSVCILHASGVALNVSGSPTPVSSKLRAARMVESSLTREELRHFLLSHPQLKAVDFSPRSTSIDIESEFPDITFTLSLNPFQWTP